MFLGNRCGKQHKNDSGILHIPASVLSVETVSYKILPATMESMKGLILTPGFVKINIECDRFVLMAQHFVRLVRKRENCFSSTFLRIISIKMYCISVHIIRCHSC